MVNIGIYFYDIYGQVLVNIYVVFDYDIVSIDSVIVGLGGCLYVNGVSGNVVMEDLFYMFNGMVIDIGVNMDLFLKVLVFVFEII